jgi:hypothetical protein
VSIALAYLVAGAALVALSLFNTYLVVTLGLGLTIKSWTVIIWCGLVIPAVIKVMAASLMRDLKDLD